MTSYAVGAAVILAADACLRFATRPVLTAYGLGRAVERIRQRGRPPGTKP
jgi:hypothetical protein